MNKREFMMAGTMAAFTGSSVYGSEGDNEGEKSMTALSHIRQIDYTVIFARDMDKMRTFYGDALGFPLRKTLGDAWFEYGVGATTLALTAYGLMFNDTPPQQGALALQLAFRVPPAEVDRCAKELEGKEIKLLFSPTDQPWGHRTVFFRDPDGNIIEIFAEI